MFIFYECGEIIGCSETAHNQLPQTTHRTQGRIAPQEAGLYCSCTNNYIAEIPILGEHQQPQLYLLVTNIPQRRNPA